MADEPLADGLSRVMSDGSTRRTIVKTGAKLAYAAPLVAASFRLSKMSAAAQAASLIPDRACENPAVCAVITESCPAGCNSINPLCTQEGTKHCTKGSLTDPCLDSSDCPVGQVCLRISCFAPGSPTSFCQQVC
jgi:hypothetical protein